MKKILIHALFYGAVVAAHAASGDNDSINFLLGSSAALIDRQSDITYGNLRVLRRQNNLTDYEILAFTNLGSGDIYYALYSDMQIRQFNLATKQYLGGWPLGVASPCGDDESCHDLWWVGRWGPDEVQEKISDNLSFIGDTAEPTKLMGCMRESPLRYGDLDGDGKSELNILLNDEDSIDWIIFSTVLHKTIFATKIHLQDEIFGIEPGRLPKDAGKHYQIWSASGAEGQSAASNTQAVRIFAKLYFSDFDADGAFDILVWRKLYESRLQADPVKGFIKKSDTFVHYKLVNGEYKKQATDQSVIKSWLTAKQLTWQKGYPSKSECPGQEGQLIPEMHDPLLNDPEVLQ